MNDKSEKELLIEVIKLLSDISKELKTLNSVIKDSYHPNNGSYNCLRVHVDNNY